MLAGVVVTLVEILGGLTLLLGLFTRWVAISLAIDMVVAHPPYTCRMAFSSQGVSSIP